MVDTITVSGCGLVAKAPALGAGDREFESHHPDHHVRMGQIGQPLKQEHEFCFSGF